MSRFNTLLHGEASEASAILGGDMPPPTETVRVLNELRAALTNALNRIDRLERKQAALVVDGVIE